MRAALALGIVGLAVTPTMFGLTLDWLRAEDVDRVLEGEDIEVVADSIAQREFVADVTLEIIELARADRVRGDLNATLRAAPGHDYVTLTVSVTNHGRVPIGVFPHHFTAEDTSGITYRAMWGIPDRIDDWNLRRGDAATGAVTFEIPDDATLASLTWTGEMGATRADI